MKRFLTLLVLGSFIAFFAGAQDAAPSSDDSDFFGDSSKTISDAKPTMDDPTAQFTKNEQGVRWGGSITSKANWSGGWIGDYPDTSSISTNWKDSVGLTLDSVFFLDARPDKDYRVKLALKTAWPFSTTTSVATPSGSTYPSTTINSVNISVWELFTDVTLYDKLYLRFGKQSAAWGISYFYQAGDLVSISKLDPLNPTAQREGPVAFKASVPFPSWKANVVGLVLASPAYFNPAVPTFRDLAYALQADALVGEAQLTVGTLYQRSLAPKMVASVNTGLSFLNLPVITNINLFAENIFSYGSDKIQGATSSGGAFATFNSWSKQWYYTGVLGATYSHPEANWSLRMEYYYNPFGSSDTSYAQKAYTTVLANASGSHLGNSDHTFSIDDALNPGIHNLTAYLTATQINGSKFGVTTLWQQNLSDSSGWIYPQLLFSPTDFLSFNAGVQVVYGLDSAQFPVQFLDMNSSKAQRVTMTVGFSLGNGRY